MTPTARRPMKLLMVGHSYVVAMNRRLCREVAAVGGDGVEVTVAAPSFYHGDLRPIPLEPDDGPAPYALEPVTGRFSKIPQLFLYGGRFRSVLGRPWDVVHAWEEPYILAGWQIARATPRGAALVFSSFQNQPKRYPPPFHWIERDCLRRSAGWTAFGQTVFDNLRGRPGYGDRPSRTIPLGIDVEAFRPDPSARQRIRGEWGWSDPGPPVVGYLGRFVPEKGLHLLMRALDRLPAGSWRAAFIGGGPLEAELRAWGGRHTDAVRVVTGVPHPEVPARLNALDLLAAPSQTRPNWKEQLGRMLLEGMAVGLPLIASDSGEIPHVVGDAGLVLPEADEDAWVEGLARLIDSPDLRRELRDRGLNRAQTVYHWQGIARQFLDFFRELREGGAGAESGETPGAVRGTA